MSAATPKKKTLPGIAIVKSMRDYGEDPFFKKKDEKAKAFIAKNGLPKFRKK
jgi:hypothetical protein